MLCDSISNGRDDFLRVQSGMSILAANELDMVKLLKLAAEELLCNLAAKSVVVQQIM
jgi:hypothetical protein